MAEHRLLASVNGVLKELPGVTIDDNGLIGYTAGVGGTVTQQTSKSTGVTLNAITGQITTHNENMNAGVAVSFILTNSFITTDSLVLVNIVGGSTTQTNYICVSQIVANGSVGIWIYNTGSGAAEALVIQFSILRGAHT